MERRGKHTVLAEYLVRAPVMAVSATSAALFRLVAAGPITVLFDEVDAIFNQKADNNEDLRGLLNAGYEQGATIARCVGDAKTMKVQRFPVEASAAWPVSRAECPPPSPPALSPSTCAAAGQTRTSASSDSAPVQRQARPIRDALQAGSPPQPIAFPLRNRSWPTASPTVPLPATDRIDRGEQ